MKKSLHFTALLGALLLGALLFALPAGATTTEMNPQIISVTTDQGGIIKKGQTFKLTITMSDTFVLSSVTSVNVESDIVASNTSAGFTVNGKVDVKKDDSPTPSTDPWLYTITFNDVTYNGGFDNTFQFSLLYKNSKQAAQTMSVTLSVDDGTTVTPTPTPVPTGSGVYVQGVTVTDVAGGEVTTVDWDDHVNIIMRVVDHSSARNHVTADEIITRINSSIFQYTGTGEISQLIEQTDAEGLYYSYVLLFRDVVYKGGGNTLPIDLTYLDSSMAMQQFSVTIGQCVDEDPNDPDKAKTPTLLVRESSYGDAPVVAGSPFTLSLTVYASAGSETLDDVIATLTLPKGVTLSGGSLSNYIGTVNAKGTRQVSFSVLPSSAYTEGVADIVVNMAGVGTTSGKAATGTCTISVPISQPDRFELGDLDLADTVNAGELTTVTLNFVNKGKNQVSNLEAVLSGTNLGDDSQTQYVGNIAAGTQNSVDFDITPPESGSFSGTITLNYEDGNGVMKSVTKDFAGTAEEAYVSDYGGGEGEGWGTETTTPAGPSPILLGIIGAIVAAVIVVLGVLALRKKRKNAAAAAELEDAADDDDDFELLPAVRGDAKSGDEHENH